MSRVRLTEYINGRATSSIVIEREHAPRAIAERVAADSVMNPDSSAVQAMVRQGLAKGRVVLPTREILVEAVEPGRPSRG